MQDGHSFWILSVQTCRRLWSITLADEWFDELDATPKRKPRAERGEIVGYSSDEGTLKKLLQRHPEGGGPYGGRDNALTACVGYYRSTRLDINFAIAGILDWNRTYCDPPMEEHEVREKAGRAWADWKDSDLPPLTPEMLRAELAQKPEAKEEPELEICGLVAVQRRRIELSRAGVDCRPNDNP